MEDDYLLGDGEADTGDDSTDNLLNGDGSDSDFVGATGGPGNGYVQNQTGYDRADTGTITSTKSITGTGTKTTATPPAWQSSLSGLFSGAGSLLTAATPLINGKPVQKPTATSSTTMYLIIGAVVVLFGGFLLLRRK